MAITHDLAGVDHVVSHCRSLDVGALLGEWPNCVLNLGEREWTVRVHCEVRHDGAHGIAGWRQRRSEGKGTEHIDPQCFVRRRRGFDCPLLRRRRWSLAYADAGRGRRRRAHEWFVMDDVDRSVPRFSAPAKAPYPEIEGSNTKNPEHCRGEVEHARERRVLRGSRCIESRLWLLRDSAQILGEVQRDFYWSSGHQRRRRDALKVLVLRPDGAAREDLESAVSARERNREIVGGVDQAVVAVGVRKAADPRWVDSRRPVAAAGSHDVAKGRGGKWFHVGEEVTPVGVAELALHRAAAHLHDEVNRAMWCTGSRVAWVLGIERCAFYDENRWQVIVSSGIDDRYLETARDLIHPPHSGVAGACVLHPSRSTRDLYERREDEESGP